MSNEAQIRISLTIRKGNLSIARNPAFQADIKSSNPKGPVPGAILVATSPGTNIDLSQLTLPGLCLITNLDPTNFVEYGIEDIVTSEFYPLGEVLPGESYPLRLSRNLSKEYPGTGTGLIAETRLRLRAHTAACNVVVEAFEA